MAEYFIHGRVPSRVRSKFLAGAAFLALTTFAGEAAAACSASGLLKVNVDWSAPLVCSAANSVAGFASINTSLAIDFLTFASPFVTSGSGATPNTIQSGFWARGVGGESTVTTNFSASIAGLGGLQGSSRVTTGYDGYQGGFDSGLLNLGNSSWNAHFGVTFGEAFATPRLGPNSDGTIPSESASNPFVGLYAVFTKDNFFANIMVRHGWQSIDITNADLGVVGGQLTANSWDVSGAAGYRFNLNGFFVEPSGGFDALTERVGIFKVPGGAVPGGAAQNVPLGAVTFNQIDTTLGFLGVRVGTAFSTSNFAVQPYLTASIWRQFDGNINAQFACGSVECAVLPTNVANIAISQIGTFGQFGAGVATQVLNTGLVSYVRADLRTGERYDSWTLSGGMRYSF